jgi:hypothetical protein
MVIEVFIAFILTILVNETANEFKENVWKCIFWQNFIMNELSNKIAKS